MGIERINDMKKRRLICVLLSVVLVLGVFGFASAQEAAEVNDAAMEIVGGAPVDAAGTREPEPPTAGTEKDSGGEEAEPSVPAEPLAQPSVQPAEPVAQPSVQSAEPVPEAQMENGGPPALTGEAAPAEDGLQIMPLAAGNEAALRADILNAAPGGVVEISNSLQLTNTPLTIDKNLTFRSTGGTVQLSVAGAIRHINASAGVTLTFEGVELVGNAPAAGGGIEAVGDITLNGASVRDCQAAAGGGVNAAGAVTLSNSVLSGNRASAGNGGGVNSGLTVYVSGSTVSQNTAAAGNGGGIYSAGAFTLNSGTIDGNNAGLNGGGVYSPAPNAFISGGTISGNTAQGDGGGYYGLSIFVLNGTVSGNHAVESGGGIFVETVTIENGTVSGNTAGDNGGGIYTEQDFEINGGSVKNNAAADGGGVYVLGEALLNGGTVSENNAAADGGGIYARGKTQYAGVEINGNTAANNGGGLYAYSSVSVSNGSLTGNTAATGNGGGIYCGGNFMIQSGTVSGNEAGANGGGVYAVAPNAFLRGGTVAGNTARQDGGGFYGSVAYVMGSSVTGNHAAADGGGLFVVDVTVESGLIDGNAADGYGGGIYAENGIEINNGTVSGNTAANGGGISTIGDVDFNRGFITGNTAHEDGGGIYGTLASITAGSGAVFADNSAARGYLIKEADKALYAAKIFTAHITQPFTYAYNNFDINYVGIEIEYVVTFDPQGGSAVRPALVTAGSAVEKPADPVRDGYVFTGWFKDAAATQPWDFATAVNSNITLYAGWREGPAPAVVYTVTFDSRGGSAVAAATDIPAGSTISAPADPTRGGYTFTGWFTDEAATRKWSFESDTVNGNITLYAGWKTAAGTAADTDAPKTGDTSGLWLYTWIAVAGASLFIVALVKIKRRRKKEY